jgi:hypothetical protein
MQQRNALFARLAAIVIVIPWAVAVAFAWLQPWLKISPAYGALIGTLAAAGLGYYVVRKAPGEKPAFAGVGALSLFTVLQAVFLFKMIAQ